MQRRGDPGDDLDFSQQYPGLNPTIMQDILDVHQAFRFGNFHFANYSVNDFKSNIIESSILCFLLSHDERK